MLIIATISTPLLPAVFVFFK